jgi:hypothetical protein
VREEQICFRVTAVNARGTSKPSAPACTTPPANPTNLSAATTDRGIDLAWTDNSAVEDGYRVSRLDASGIWNDIATLPANATGYTDADVAPDLTYTYRVQALENGGVSDYSNEAAGAIATAVPTAPGGVVAVYYSGLWTGWLYLDVSWTDTSGNEVGFRIEESTDGISGWSTVSVALANRPHVLEQYDQYAFPSFFDACYRVVAFNSLGDSAPSNVFCTGWGGAPQNLVATAVDPHTVDLAWTGVARFASGYEVVRYDCELFDSCYHLVASLPPGATNFRETDLAAGREYRYLVYVTYPDGWGDFYNEAYAIVATPP